jgi:hypothetical protein
MKIGRFVGSLLGRPRVRIINFVSTHPNIGNYTPVWGIWRMLPGLQPTIQIDCRQFGRVSARDYDVAIVGGGGLLHAVFEPFWEWLSRQSLPLVLWGIGGCWPAEGTLWRSRNASEGCVAPSILKRMKKQIVLANVRDALTRDSYDLDADISFCPTAEYFKAERRSLGRGTEVLYAHHDELVTDRERDEIVRYCSLDTSNIAQARETFVRILQKYRRAEVIVTSRLHGAIIANSLGRPYVALIRDRKFDEFHATYGYGVACDSLAQLPARIEAARRLPAAREIDYQAIEAFGRKTMGCLETLSSATPRSLGWRS